MPITRVRSIFLAVHFAGDFSSFEVSADKELATERREAEFDQSGVGTRNHQLLRSILRKIEDAYARHDSVELTTQDNEIIDA